MSDDQRHTPLIPSLTLTTFIDTADVLVVGLTATSSDDPTVQIVGGGLDDAVAAAITASLIAVNARAALGTTARIAAPVGLPVASIVGVGIDGSAEESERIRRAAGSAIRSLSGVESVVSTLSTIDIDAAAQGFALGAYSFEEFRSDTHRAADTPPSSVALWVSAADNAAQTSMARAAAISTAVARARDFVNTPPSHLYPEEFANRAAEFGRAAGLDVEVVDFDALEAGGYGGIVGVGKGSSRLPRLVRMAYRSTSPNAKTVALVGKGITFDTGGISIKPALHMEHMTSDMGGAAAVIATVILAAELDVAVNVTATVPMAENMPSGTAQRPGDVLTQYGGMTTEVLNTDAEGRLVLADAMVRACEDNPDYLIDTATLTGAQTVALGVRTPGVMGTDAFRDRVATISQSVGENAWPMPLPEELTADLKSRVADQANVTNHRNGGMLAAAIFLQEFVAEDVQWAHIDIAGPAYNTGSPWGYTPKGGTGVPVRTLIAVIDDIAARG